MDASMHAERARRIAAEPTARQRQRAEAEGWRRHLRPRKLTRPVHPLEQEEARLLRAERDIRMLDAMR